MAAFQRQLVHHLLDTEAIGETREVTSEGTGERAGAGNGQSAGAGQEDMGQAAAKGTRGAV